MEPEPVVKPGWMTTEFYLTVFGSIATILVATGIIGREDVENINDAIANAVKSVAGLVSAVVILWRYFKSRAEVKRASADAIVSANEVKLAAMTSGTIGKTITAVLIALIAFNPCMSYAADYLFIKKGNQYWQVDTNNPANPNRQVTVTIVESGGPIVIPVDPVVPTPGDLPAAVKQGLAAVPAYDKKQEDQRVLAYTLNILSSAVAKAGDTVQAHALVRSGCDVALGPNRDKWVNFWPIVEPKLNVTNTNPGDIYASSLKTVSDALVADLPLSDAVDEKSGERTYGLDLARIIELMTKLLPIIELIMKLLAKDPAMMLYFLNYIPVGV